MKIYIASSWKNEDAVLRLARILRSAGHDVFAFCEDGAGHYCFHYSELSGYESMTCVEFLESPQAQQAYKSDKAGIDWSDAVVMLLPCGKSSHLEAGYAKGCGKTMVILGKFEEGEFDCMYGFADALIDINDTRWAKHLCAFLSE